jgi:dienelactone hydrolase
MLGKAGSLALTLLVSTALSAGERPQPAQGTVTFAPTAAESQVAERFRLPPGEFAWRAEPLGADSSTVEVWNVTFPSPVVTPFEANNTVHCEYFQPKCAGKRPAVIVLHILGGDFPLSRLFCNRMAQQGVAALFVKMPFYGPRRGEGVERRMISANPEETVEGMTQAVLDIRRATAWLASREEVDSEQIGVFGISLGGITGALAATAEPRIQNICLLLAGGDISRLALDAPDLGKVRGELPKPGEDLEKFQKAMRVIDPVTYAANARGRRILMLNADRDEIIPRACTESLHKALGEPELVWYSGGHYSVIRHLFKALDRVANFFAAVDGAGVPQPIYRAGEPPAIDGVLDDACWGEARAVLASRRLGRAGRFASPAPMSVRLAWDKEFLYVGYELAQLPLERGEQDSRLVKLLTSSGSREEFWQLELSDGQPPSTAFCRVPPLSDCAKDGPPRLALVSFDKERKLTADGKTAGLTGEVRIPWAELGMPPDGQMAGLELTLLAVVESGTQAESAVYSTGELPKQPPHFSASRWPKYKLAEKR